MIEYGRMVMVQQVITNASREGARRAVLEGATANDVKATVTEYLTSAGIDGNADYVTLTPSEPSAAGYREPVTVQVEVPFADVSWLGGPLDFIFVPGGEDVSLGGTNLKATTVMSRESVQ